MPPTSSPRNRRLGGSRALAAIDGSVGEPHYQQSTEPRRRGDNQSDRNDSTYRHCADPCPRA